MIFQTFKTDDPKIYSSLLKKISQECSSCLSNNLKKYSRNDFAFKFNDKVIEVYYLKLEFSTCTKCAHSNLYSINLLDSDYCFSFNHALMNNKDFGIISISFSSLKRNRSKIKKMVNGQLDVSLHFKN